MISIVPSIIPDSYDDLVDHVAQVKGVVSRVQVDVLDGVYVKNARSWPYNHHDHEAFVKLVTQEEGLPFWEQVDYEIDMMVRQPEEKVDDWIHAGAKTLIIHFESTDRIGEIIERAHELGADVALALKPSTDSALLTPWLDTIEFVQFMGSDDIGRHGVLLDRAVLGKIIDFRKMHPSVTIGIDIGVNETTIAELASVGVTHFAAGSSVFQDNETRANVEYLKELSQEIGDR